MLACLTLAACGAPSNKTAGATAKKVPLVLYAAEGYDSAEATAFQKATGIKVELDDDSTGPLTTKIEAEKNNPQWDLFWVDGDAVFASLDKQGQLLKGWEPSAVDHYNSVGRSLIPSDHSYVPTGVTMAAALVYNAQTVSSPPTSWSQLLGSEWKGEVGMNDPAVSGPTYPYVAGQMAHLGGVRQGEQYFTKLHANGLHVYQTNTNTLQALETGQIKVATIQSSAGIGAGTKDPHIKVAYLGPETVLPSVLGIDSKASKQAQAEAKQFVEFVLSPAGQKVMQSGDPTGDSLFWPLISGEKPLSELPPLSSVPTQTINPYTWGPREASVNTWFTDNIVQ
ncbi:MAG TPA: extracellular solute-binding protein [Candidatus Dormibacteraeota bacterium]|nr:extracellular solute-binding protein [Candidatus Dormibacteraeota bacterium]